LNAKQEDLRLRALLERCDRLGISRIAKDDPRFPKNMLRLPSCPQAIYVRGSLPRVKSVACIGTREATLFGRRAAAGIVGALSANGWSIVSGLAVGIDTACHRAALEAGGHTVAVLAHGLNMPVYPPENTGLAQEILSSGGALISEYPPDTRATRWSFVARDRLQAALSLATICVQTGTRGGSMHAVQSTIDLHRPLFVPVVPDGYRLEPKNAGIIGLLRDGRAEPIASKADYPALLRRLEKLALDSDESS